MFNLAFRNEETNQASTSIEVTAADDQSKDSSGDEAGECFHNLIYIYFFFIFVIYNI